jgi:hypothetical protein
VKGALHAHSDLSHDGVLTLSELRSFFQSRGFDLLCVTDHSDDLDDANYNSFVKETERLSDSDFQIIPGIEFTCSDEVHIMGVGIREFAAETDHVKVISHIHNQQGMAILSHPTKTEFDYQPAWISKLDGAELWNVAYDGKYLPDLKSIDAFFRLKQINPRLRAFFGIDFHRPRGYFGTSMRIERESMRRNGLVKTLLDCKYRCSSPLFAAGPHPSVGALSQLYLGGGKALLYCARAVRNLVRGR